MSRRKQHKPQALRNGETAKADLNTQQRLCNESDYDDDDDDDGANAIHHDAFSSNPEDLLDNDVANLDSTGNSPGDDERMALSALIYACTYCSACFETNSQVKAHEQEHADIMPYRCPQCLKGFKHKRSLDRHVKLHIGVKKYKCSFCQTAFFRSDHLKLHLKTLETSKYQYSCSICQRGFHSLPGLQSHAVVHSVAAESVKISALNGETSAEKNSGIDSIRAVDTAVDMTQASLGVFAAKKYDPTACAALNHEDVAPLPVETSPHLFADSEAIPLLNDAVSFVSHPALLNQNGALAFASITCSVCAAIFPDVDALQAHTPKRHSLNELSAISTSTSRFTSRDVNQEDPVYTCDQCHRHFDSILSLHSHISATHEASSQGSDSLSSVGRTTTQIYQCSQCDFSVQNLKAFTTHMRQHVQPALNVSSSHFSEMNVKAQSLSPLTHCFCDVCHVTLIDQSTLESHLIGHYLRAEVQYAWTHCVDSRNSGGRLVFNSLDDLHKHLTELHTKLIYRCSICCDIFDSRNELEMHYVIMHAVTLLRFRCTSCNAVFLSDDQFKVHIRAAHLPAPVNCFSTLQTPYNNNNNLGVTTANPFACPLCLDSFSVEYLYDKHMQVVHMNEQRSFVAQDSATDDLLSNGSSTNHNSTSDMAANNTTSNKYSSATVAPISASKCNICDDRFNSVVELTNHKLFKHCKVLRSERCNICKDPVLNTEHFFKHIRVHTTPGSQATCVICKESLASVVEMQAHAKFHCEGAVGDDTSSLKDARSPAPPPAAASPEQRCLSCQVKFETLLEFEQHRSTCCKVATSVTETYNSADNKVYQCIKCQKSFESEQKIHQHIALHMLNDGVDHKCYLCSRVFDSPSKLQRHLIEHSCHQSISPTSTGPDGAVISAAATNTSNGCSAAATGAAGPGANPSNSVGFRCWMCNELCADSSALQAHVLTSAKHAKEKRPHRCDWCDQTFFFDAELENHLIASHPPPDAARGANATDPKQSTTSNVQGCSPLESETASIPAAASDPSTSNAFVCELCGVAFSLASTLKSHVAQCRRKSALAESTESLRQLPPCPSNLGPPTMVSCKSILAELMTKTGSDNVNCNVNKSEQKIKSGGVSSSASNVGGPFQCPNCPKSFLSMSSLQGHSHVHMNTIKAHHCDKCKKTFQTAAKLCNHQRQHSGDKPFMCHLCNRYFSRKDNLKVHLKTHFKSDSIVQASLAQNGDVRPWLNAPQNDGNIVALSAANAPVKSCDNTAVDEQ